MIASIPCSSSFFITNWLKAIINAIANGSNTDTIKMIKNLTTDFNGTPKASATNLNPPTSFSKSIFLSLILFISSLYFTFSSCSPLILSDILDVCLSLLSTDLNNLLLTLPLSNILP